MFYDFDGATFKIENPNSNPEKTILAFKCQGAKKILENGGEDFLKEKYSKFYKGEAHENYNVVLSVESEDKPQKKNIPSDASDEEKAKIKEENAGIKQKLSTMAYEVAEMWSGLKSDFMGAPIRKALVDLKEENKETYLLDIPYRKDERYWVKKTETNAIIFFSVHFTEATDIALAKIMCNEFKDSKKSSAQAVSVNYFPKVDSSIDVINDLKADPKKSSCGIISFTLTNVHVKKNLETAVYFLATFRQYVEFHVRMVKCLLHTRMRKRIGKFEIVFEKALREGVTKKTEYKTTIGGAAKTDKADEDKVKVLSKKKEYKEEEYTIG